MDELFKQICKVIRAYARAAGISELEALEICMPETLKVLENYVREEFNSPIRK